MNNKEIIKTLKTHNKWRRGADIPMPHPKIIGQAIDCAIKHIENNMDKVISTDQHEPIYKNRFVLDFGVENFDISVTSISELKYSGGEWDDIRVDFVGISEIETLKNIMALKKKMSEEGNLNFMLKLVDATGVIIDSYIISSNAIDFSLDNYDINDDSYVMPWVVFKNVDVVNEYLSK